MKRKLLTALSLVLCLCAVATFASCKKDDGEKKPAETTTVADTAEPAPVGAPLAGEPITATEIDAADLEAAKQQVIDNGRTPVVVTVYDESFDDGALLSIGEATGDYETICVNDLGIKDEIKAMPLAPRVLSASAYENKILAKANDDQKALLGIYYVSATSNGSPIFGLSQDILDRDIEDIAACLKEVGYTADDMFADYVEAGVVPTLTDALVPTVLNSDNCEYSVKHNEVTITKYKGTSGNVIIPATIDDMPVTTIAAESFFQKNLHALTTSDNLKTIDAEAFVYTLGLKDINFSAATTNIGKNAFMNALFTETNGDFKVFAGIATEYTGTATDIVIPEGIKFVGAGLVYDAKNVNETTVTSVTFPEGLVAIGEKAFYECTALANVTFPSTLTAIGNQAFYNNKAAISIALPASMVNVGDYAFQGCENVTALTLNEGLKTIGKNAFEYCLSTGPDAETRYAVALPSTIELIDNEAFKNCNRVNEITGGENIVRLGKDVFHTTKWYPAFCKDKGDFITWNGILIDYRGKEAEVTIPNDVRGIAGAFTDAYKLITKVTINDGCVFIADEEFNANCPNLDTITIPASVTYIGDNVLDESRAFERPNSEKPGEMIPAISAVICEEGSVAYEYASSRQLKTEKIG